jgi:hypothetical protein
MPLAELLDPDDWGRAAELAAFLGCLRGGMTEHLDQGGSDVRVYGAGVWLSREVQLFSGGAHPMVLADPTLLGFATSGTATPAHDYPELIQHLRVLTSGAEPAPDLVAVSADMPREHFAETQTAFGTLRGVFGASATMNGQPCLLTAGHVAAGNATNPVGVGSGYQVQNSAGQVASVIFAMHAGTTTGRVLATDIAVVQLAHPAGRDPRINGPGSPRIDDKLTRLGGSAVGAGGMPYRGFCSWVRVDQRLGLWGKVYMTEQQLGSPGDSGSAVIDPQGRVIGHYLGATTANGFVQQLAYQLPQGCTVP